MHGLHSQSPAATSEGPSLNNAERSLELTSWLQALNLEIRLGKTDPVLSGMCLRQRQQNDPQRALRPLPIWCSKGVSEYSARIAKRNAREQGLGSRRKKLNFKIQGISYVLEFVENDVKTFRSTKMALFYATVLKREVLLFDLITTFCIALSQL